MAMPLRAITPSSAASGDIRGRRVDREKSFAAVTGKSFGILAQVGFPGESGNLGPIGVLSKGEGRRYHQ